MQPQSSSCQVQQRAQKKRTHAYACRSCVGKNLIGAALAPQSSSRQEKQRAQKKHIRAHTHAHTRTRTHAHAHALGQRSCMEKSERGLPSEVARKRKEEAPILIWSLPSPRGLHRSCVKKKVCVWHNGVMVLPRQPLIDFCCFSMFFPMSCCQIPGAAARELQQLPPRGQAPRSTNQSPCAANNSP